MEKVGNECLFIDWIYRGYLKIDSKGKIWKIAKKHGNQYVKDSFTKIKKRRAENNIKGYLRISRVINGKSIACFAHRLVWIYFNGKIPNNLQINHKNGIKTDNRPENLELCTASENQKHSFKIGLAFGQKGEKNPMAKLNKKNIIEIRNRYENNETQISIAKDFNITQGHIYSIVNRKSWIHVE